MYENSILQEVDKKHPNHHLFSAIKLALSCSTVNYETTMEFRDLFPPHYKLIVRDTFEISKDMNGHVKEYAPDVFQALRTARGITKRQFLQSCCHLTLPYLQLKSKKTRNLYLTHDKKFIVKVTSLSKINTLTSYLKDYMQHLISSPSTLLVKVIGLFTIELPFFSTTHIMVMENLFFPDYGITRRFNLKGCQNRNSYRQCTEENDNFQEYVLYDNEFLRKKFKLKDCQKPFLLQMQADLKFLYRHGLFGYSLLVGTHPRTAREITADREILNNNNKKKTQRRSSVEHFADLRKTCVSPEVCYSSPLRIVDGQYYTFYLGIIGIFQRYTFGDRLVSVLKTIRFCGTDHSTKSPKIYYQRLLAVVEKCCSCESRTQPPPRPV